MPKKPSHVPPGWERQWVKKIPAGTLRCKPMRIAKTDKEIYIVSLLKDGQASNVSSGHSPSLAMTRAEAIYGQTEKSADDILREISTALRSG